EAIADCVIAPGVWAPTASSQPLPLIHGDSSLSVRPACKPLSLYTLAMVGHRLGFLLLPAGIRLGLLVRQLPRMHDDKAHYLLRDTPIAVCDFHLSEHALTMPTPGCLSLGPLGLLHQQGQGRWLTSPGFESLPDGTGTRD